MLRIERSLKSILIGDESDRKSWASIIIIITLLSLIITPDEIPIFVSSFARFIKFEFPQYNSILCVIDWNEKGIFARVKNDEIYDLNFWCKYVRSSHESGKDDIKIEKNTLTASFFAHHFSPDILVPFLELIYEIEIENSFSTLMNARKMLMRSFHEFLSHGYTN